MSAARYLAGLVLSASFSLCVLGQEPKPPPARKFTPEQTEKLKERGTLYDAAVKAEQERRMRDAVVAHEKALTITREVFGPNDPQVAQSLAKIGDLHMSMENWESARASRQAAVNLLTAIHGKENWRVADARQDRADVDLFDKMSAENRTAARRVGVLLAEGIRMQNLGGHEQARKPFTEALNAAKRAFGPNHLKVAICLNRLASTHQAVSDLAKAEALHLESLAIFSRTVGPVHPHYAAGLNNLASIHKERGQYAKAEPLFRMSLEIRQATVGERHPDYATALMNLAGLFIDTGDYAAAETLNERAIAIFQDSLGPDDPRTILCLGNLAVTYSLLEQHAKALPLLTKVVEHQRKHLGADSPVYAMSLNNLGIAHLDAGELMKAEELISKGLHIIGGTQGREHPNYSQVLNNLAMCYRGSPVPGEAERFLKMALELREKTLGKSHPSYAESVSNLALFHLDAGDLKKSAPLYWEATTIRLDVLARTADVQSEGSQMLFSQVVQGVLSGYLQASVGGSPAEACSLALRWKGQVFVRQRRMRELARAANDPRTEKLAALLLESTRQLAAVAGQTPAQDKAEEWKKRVMQLVAQREHDERELVLASASFGKQIERETLTAEQLRKLLPANAGLVDFLVYSRMRVDPKRRGGSVREDHLLAFIIRPDREIVRVELGLFEPIREAIDDWRKDTLRKRPVRDEDDPAAVLRDKLWRPVAEHLEGVPIVLISPDRDLAKLPFAALPGSKDGAYLIEERAIATLPVPQFLPDLLTPMPAAKPSLLAVGDVDYAAEAGLPATGGGSQIAVRGTRGGTGWKPLPGTRDEIAAIRASFASSFPEHASKTLRGAEPTEDALRSAMGRHRWVHLATHGFFAPPDVKAAGATRSTSLALAGHLPGLLSGIVLAGANRPTDPLAGGDDGILTAAEVVTLDLQGVEMVVLSACETGLGKTAGGEGVLGLQRAFQVAGARTVVASLWEVPDESTRALMTRAYENWWTGKKSKLEGLVEAQRRILKEGRGKTPPLHWAAFVLSGDWR